MKNSVKMLLVALTIGVTTTVLLAQEGRPNREGGRPPGPPPVPPIIAALDLNGDGEIDADEIAKASDSLKKLDKNGDGKLTRDELRPPRPGGADGPDEGGGPRGPHDGGGKNQPRPLPPGQ